MGSRAGSSEISTTRTSKTGWLKDSAHAVVAKMTARIAGVTGLAANPNMEDAELMQVTGCIHQYYSIQLYCILYTVIYCTLHLYCTTALYTCTTCCRSPTT